MLELLAFQACNHDIVWWSFKISETIKGMIKDLDGSMVNVRLIETDISFWIYSGDPIFIENEEFISANFKIKFDSAPMEYLQECSTSEVLSESISSFHH